MIVQNANGALQGGSGRRGARLYTLTGILKVFLGLLFIFPILYAVWISVNTNGNAAAMRYFTFDLTLENYRQVFGEFNVPRYVMNSFVTVAISVTSQVVTCSLAAYAFVFFTFKGRNILFTIITLSMMIPGDSVIIANYMTVLSLNLTNTYLGISIVSLTSGMGIFLMRQAFKTVPLELKDASEIDGCGRMRFLIQILLPISVPSIAAMAIYLFIGNYNQFFWPLLVTSRDSMRTIQVGVSLLMDEETGKFGAQCAVAMVALIIPILVFTVAYKYLVKGMTAGAVKG